jgi:hypothetical protein
MSLLLFCDFREGIALCTLHLGGGSAVNPKAKRQLGNGTCAATESKAACNGAQPLAIMPPAHEERMLSARFIHAALRRDLLFALSYPAAEYDRPDAQVAPADEHLQSVMS